MSYGLYRPGSSYYSTPTRSYGTTPGYSSYGSSSYSKPSSYTPSSSTYGSSYIPTARERSVDRSGGYTSDYGKSGYTSDYGKSGYTSDRNRPGYTSDYRNSNYSRPTYGSLSRQNSINRDASLSRQNSINRRDSLNLSSSLRDPLTRRDSYNYGRFSRSQSREEEPKVNGLAKSDSNSRNGCKAPADFTSEESESESTEEEEENESDNCEVPKLGLGEYLAVTRGTSPIKEEGEKVSKSALAAIVKERKKRKLGYIRKSEKSCQVNPDDFPSRRQRFISSRPTSLYVNKYYPSTNTKRFSVGPAANGSSRTYGSGRSNSVTSLEGRASRSPSITNAKPMTFQKKQQLSVDEPVSAGGFSRDASPNDTKPPTAKKDADEPNKDFRKSILNMNLDDKMKDEVSRRQEERRRHKRRGNNQLSIDQPNISTSPSSSSSSSEDDADRIEEGDNENKKKRYVKKSPSRTGMKELAKCGSRSKMTTPGDNLKKSDSKAKVDTNVLKSPSHSRVTRRRDAPQTNGEAKAPTTTSSSSSSSSSSSDEKRSRPSARQRRRGDKSSNKEDSSSSKPEENSKTTEDTPTVVITKSPAISESKPSLEVPGKLVKASSGSSDMTSPGEVVHLPFPGIKAPPKIQRADSGRNVAVSVDIAADFIKPSTEKKKDSSSSSTTTTSSSEESSSSDEGDGDRSLKTPVVPVVEPQPIVQPVQEAKKSSSSSSSSSSEDNDASEEQKNALSSNVQKSATVIHVTEPLHVASGKKSSSSSSSSESSEEESSEEEEEEVKDKKEELKAEEKKPSVPVQAKKESESEESSESESSEEEDSSDEKKPSSETKADVSKEQENKAKLSAPCATDAKRLSSSSATTTSSESRRRSSAASVNNAPQDPTTLFIGQCRDIDEMLGAPSPVSPGSATVLSPSKLQPFRFITTEDDRKPSVAEEKKKSSSSSSSEESSSEESSSSSDIEEVEASAVKFHESKPQKPELGAYTEEIDSSAVRIRDGRALNPELHQLTEEIDSSSVKVREPKPMHGHITKTPTQKAKRVDGSHLFGRRDSEKSSTSGTSSNAGSRRSSSNISNQLDAKAQALIDNLNTQTNRDLRKTLFSLKQIFQDEKDLIRPFVAKGGLTCLIKSGANTDQNHQNYILRALGQMMLYVDGMTGIMQHTDTLRWLYNLVASKYRIISKMALKLLVVFVEYTSSNSALLREVVASIDKTRGCPQWQNVMNLLKEKDNLDMEQLVYCMTLINKVADGIPDQDGYYDFVDCLEEQGMEKVQQFHLCRAGTDKDLLAQLQIYEAVLKREDGDDEGKPFPGELLVRQTARISDQTSTLQRRKSRRYSATSVVPPQSPKTPSSPAVSTPGKSMAPPWVRRDSATRKESLPAPPEPKVEAPELEDENEITPALRRRRERNRTLTNRDDPCHPSNVLNQSLPSPEVKEKPAFHSDRATCPSLVSRQRSLFESQIEDESKKENQAPTNRGPSKVESSVPTLMKQTSIQEVKSTIPAPTVTQQQKDKHEPTSPAYKGYQPAFRRQSSGSGTTPAVPQVSPAEPASQATPPKKIYGLSNKSPSPYSPAVQDNKKGFSWGQAPKTEPPKEKPLSPVKMEMSVKDVQNRLTTPSKPAPTNEARSPTFGGAPGYISKAKEGLASGFGVKTEPKTPMTMNTTTYRRSASASGELEWDNLMQTMRRPLHINDLDFTDLADDDDVDILNGPVHSAPFPGPPPPPGPGGPPPPPPPGGMMGPPPPPPPGCPPGPPPPPGIPNTRTAAPAPPPWMRKTANTNVAQQNPNPVKNNKKKTVKLFWKEVREEPMLLERTGKKRTIWDELKPVSLDVQRLESLFESKAKDIMSKKLQEGGKKNEIIVLDTKRSNAINIGMTKLPPPRAIKAAIMKMDTTIMNREGIEKILTTMMPTDEEKTKITEAQTANPDTPLGSAEQFLLTLASISVLEARLKLWAFRLDYEVMEKEVAEPLMDLKQAIVEIECSKTFRLVLSTLLSIGNFLNGVNAKGFNIEYLCKVPEVKDTVHKHSLLHHICTIVMEKFPESTDLYSEFGAVTRASKADFDEVARNLIKMEAECKASWDHLKLVTKHDGIPITKSRLSDFLTDCAERIIVLGIIHRRVIHRFYKLMVFLGYPSFSIRDVKVTQICKTISEFSLEYRTSRERVQQQIEKAAAQKEKERQRAKMAAEAERFQRQTPQQKEDQQLRQILGESDLEDGKMTRWGSMVSLRGRPKTGSINRPNSVMLLDRCGYSTPYESTTDIDDEILESLVKTATAQPCRTEPRTRKKARYADRKSLRRTLKGGLDLGDATT